MKDYLKNETISLCRNQYEIQICIPACKMNSEFFPITSLYYSTFLRRVQIMLKMSTVEYLMVLYSKRLVWPVLILHKRVSARKERERVQTYAKDTTEKRKTDLKLFDTDGDGKNPWQKKNTILTKELNSHHL